MSDKNKSENKNKKSESEKSHSVQSPAPTIIEWSVRGISLLLIVALIGYFIYQATLPIKKTDFTFNIKEDKIEQRGQFWKIPVDITNTGSNSVHTLKVSAKMDKKKQSTKNTEKQISIAILGPGETRSTEFWFDHHPNNEDLNFEVVSYELP